MKLKLVSFLFALLVAACTSTGPRTTPDGYAASPAPALWQISDEDTTIWLFGTIHVLPAGFEWRTPTIDTALANADQLVLETVSGGDQNSAAMLLMRLGVSPEMPPVSERIDPELLPNLASMIARGPFPESFLNGLETWAASLMLVGVTLNDLGLDPENGVEEQLELIFQLRGVPIIGLETPEEQLSLFDTLPEEAQRHFLATVIDTPEDIQREFADMLNAWAIGDEAAIALTFDSELAVSRDLRDALLTNRNRSWATWITERLEEPGTVFVAVGAGHLTGEDSVQEILDESGIRTTRLQ